MNSKNTDIILGPPGTGKTTELIRIVETCLSSGVSPADICFISFTRKAANEARDRAVEKFHLTSDQFPLFRTIHSLVFRQCSLNRTEVMGIRDYFEIAKALGLFITAKGIQEDGTILGLSKGDRLFFMEAMARARMLDLKEYWEKFPDEDINFWELEQLERTVAEYKQQNNKVDFIDMLYRFLADGVVPPHKILIVDEAQDLSPLQWEVVAKLSNVAKEIYIAGDDDQAIFTWAGADVERFMSIPGRRKILHQSYRVPIEVQKVAQSIVDKMDNRIEKTWKPREAKGLVQHAADISQLDLSKGTWLLLGRNIYILQKYVNHCLTEGFVFDSVTGSPVKGESLRAIITWETLRKLEQVSAARVKKMYEFMSTRERIKYGSKSQLEKVPDNEMLSIQELTASYGLLTDSIWHTALDKIPDVEREYFLSALRKGEKLLKEPRIKISTIHSVKGGEAENVVVTLDMAQRTYQEFQNDPDSEHRVWYVAVTRAKESLYIIEPQTNNCYTL